jgi:hypothetical protein
MTVNSEFERGLEETIGALCTVPPRDLNREFTYVYVCVYIYIYIYIYTHTHTHTQEGGIQKYPGRFFF